MYNGMQCITACNACTYERTNKGGRSGGGGRERKREGERRRLRVGGTVRGEREVENRPWRI